MTVDAAVEYGEDTSPVENSASTTAISSVRLILNPNEEHVPDNYEDLEVDFNPCVLSSLEKHLPLDMLKSSREEKARFMSDIIHKYITREEILSAKSYKEYKQKIISNYQPLYKELYTLDPTLFFVPSFLNAMKDKSEKSLKSIVSEPSPGVIVFEMFQPKFCEMMISEVENFREWVSETELQILRPNNISNCGVVLDDFGLDGMLDKLVEGFILPITKAFFSDVCGSTLDCHHGFVEYGKESDADFDFHVDESEVTLNVCLGKDFAGGERYFQGIRCEKHVNTDTKPEETFDYCHVPGQAVLHCGCHRYGSRATTSGDHVNMILLCRSSVFRETKAYRGEYLNRCGQCIQERKEKRSQTVAARKRILSLEIDLSSLNRSSLFIVTFLNSVRLWRVHGTLSLYCRLTLSGKYASVFPDHSLYDTLCDLATIRPTEFVLTSLCWACLRRIFMGFGLNGPRGRAQFLNGLQTLTQLT
ncbi:unnamed protein product [Cochlearia groenlandica]